MIQHEEKSKHTSLALFCKVVDNYGDIGICWRLARQLQREHGIHVQLWVDDLVSFQRICPSLTLDIDRQFIAEVEIRWWKNQELEFKPNEIADIVIEFFACDIPPSYITAMSQCSERPVWFNLEGLTAEEWVEGCHRLPSSHPRLPLTKYFFFPGFNERTGGLMFETELENQRLAFLANSELKNDFLRNIGADEVDLSAFKISLFCYPHAPVASLLSTLIANEHPTFLLIPEGVASVTLNSFFGRELKSGETVSLGNLRVRIFPFLAQDDYDKLLWACDFNFVRGEDSFVRAQWAQVPFIWHIYPQDDNLHHKKLRAFLSTYTPINDALQDLSLAWNEVVQVSDWSALWAKVIDQHLQTQLQTREWAQQKQKNGDLSANLLRFVEEIKQKTS